MFISFAPPKEMNQRKGGGCPSYHPRLLLKLLVYGYISNQNSRRKIEINPRLSHYISIIRERLMSVRGKAAKNQEKILVFLESEKNLLKILCF
jgi:hypothetical protein